MRTPKQKPQEFKNQEDQLVIKDRRSICVPIKTGDNLKGKLAIKYSQIDNDRAVKENMTRILETIAPHLSELMYL